jgi:hypothetical protein
VNFAGGLVLTLISSVWPAKNTKAVSKIAKSIAKNGAATPDEVAVHGNARQAVDVRAIDDHLVVGPDSRVERVRAIEMDRARNVLGVERPAVERHDQLEVVAPVELRLQFVTADRPNRLEPQRSVLVWLVHGHRNHRAVGGRALRRLRMAIASVQVPLPIRWHAAGWIEWEVAKQSLE